MEDGGEGESDRVTNGVNSCCQGFCFERQGVLVVSVEPKCPKIKKQKTTKQDVSFSLHICEKLTLFRSSIVNQENFLAVSGCCS